MTEPFRAVKGWLSSSAHRNEGSAGRAAMSERARYRATFVEHAALAIALRTLRPAPVRAGADGRLRVTFLSPLPSSHLGTEVRFTRWVPYLQALGCDVEVLGAATDAEFADFTSGKTNADTRYYHACISSQWRNIRRAAAADVIVLHRGLFPFSPWQRPTFERLLARLNPHLVYDFYDPIWLQRRAANRRPSRAARWLHPADKIEELIRLAKVVTVSNEPLARFARRHHPDVRIVPILLEPGEYEPQRHKQRSPVVLGWLGSAGNLPLLFSIAPALRRLAARRDIVVRVVSSESVEIPGVPVESHTHPWTPQSEVEDLATLDIGLLPLEDDPKDINRSPYKLMQYLAAGLPVVATPVAIDVTRLKSGEAFLAASSEDEWVASLERLVDDVDLRARLGNSGREAVVAHYSFKRHAPAFLDTLVTASGRK